MLNEASKPIHRWHGLLLGQETLQSRLRGILWLNSQLLLNALHLLLNDINLLLNAIHLLSLSETCCQISARRCFSRWCLAHASSKL